MAVLTSTMRDPQTIEAFYDRSEQRESADSNVIRINGGITSSSGIHHAIVSILASVSELSMQDLIDKIPEISVGDLNAALRDLARADLIALLSPFQPHRLLENAA